MKFLFLMILLPAVFFSLQGARLEEPRSDAEYPVMGKVRITDPKALVAYVTRKTFGYKHVAPMLSVVQHESGFNPLAVNKASGATGLGQALPVSKMGCADLKDIGCQVAWMMKYVRERYQTPQLAWNFWQANNYW